MSDRPLAQILDVLALDLKGLQQIAAALDEVLCNPAEHLTPHDLQQVDFLQQYLEDLAALSHALSTAVPTNIQIDAERLAHQVRLDDLKRHLLGTDCANSVSPRQGGDVSLF